MAGNLVDDLAEDNEQGKQYDLTPYETEYIKELSVMLQFHIAKDRIITNFITYIVMTRLGLESVKDGYDLRYAIEVETEPYKLRVREVEREK